MAQQARGPRVHERWAHLRFSVIGQLLAAPPPKGELRAEIEALASAQRLDLVARFLEAAAGLGLHIRLLFDKRKVLITERLSVSALAAFRAGWLIGVPGPPGFNSLAYDLEQIRR
jgi:hypothetical protein